MKTGLGRNHYLPERKGHWSWDASHAMARRRRSGKLAMGVLGKVLFEAATGCPAVVGARIDREGDEVRVRIPTVDRPLDLL